MLRRFVATSLLLAAAVAGAAPAENGRRAHDCVRGNELWFRAADGTRLVGHRFGGTRPRNRTTVILAHQSEGSLCEWLPYARELAADGRFVFAFDFRGHGFSRGTDGSWGRLPGDVAAATRTVRRLGARKIVVVGSSMGALASLVAAPNLRPPVSGVVSLSAPARYGALDALVWVRRLRTPVLYIAAERDVMGSIDFARDARALHAATRTEAKRLEIFDGSLHGIALLEETPTVKAAVEQFIAAR